MQKSFKIANIPVTLLPDLSYVFHSLTSLSRSLPGPAYGVEEHYTWPLLSFLGLPGSGEEDADGHWGFDPRAQLVSLLSALHRMSPVFCLMLSVLSARPSCCQPWGGYGLHPSRRDRESTIWRGWPRPTSQMTRGGSECRAPAQGLGSLGASTQIPCHPVS